MGKSTRMGSWTVVYCCLDWLLTRMGLLTKMVINRNGSSMLFIVDLTNVLYDEASLTITHCKKHLLSIQATPNSTTVRHQSTRKHSEPSASPISQPSFLAMANYQQSTTRKHSWTITIHQASSAIGCIAMTNSIRNLRNGSPFGPAPSPSPEVRPLRNFGSKPGSIGSGGEEGAELPRPKTWVFRLVENDRLIVANNDVVVWNGWWWIS